MSDNEKQSDPDSHKASDGHCRRRKTSAADPFPPDHTCCERFVLWVARAFMILSGLFLVCMCLQFLLDADVIPSCSYCTYIALSIFLIGLLTDRIIRHKILVHEARTADRSEIEALIQEAKNLISMRGQTEEHAPIYNLDTLKQQVSIEVKRLESLGSKSWTEYQVLTLDRLIVDLLTTEDLKARARSNLVELQEYAVGDAFSYDYQPYRDWEERINMDIEKIEMSSTEKNDQKNAVEKLRADLRSLLEHIASYESNWAQGKLIVVGIRICGSAAVPVFIMMGLLGLIYPCFGTVAELPPSLGILHWGFLGSAGAITSVLIGLRNSNAVEVGNSEGFQELWRAVLGATLGFVAGILIFSAFAAGLIGDGTHVQKNLVCPPLGDMDNYLSIVLAVVAGMGFENVFQRIRGVVNS